MSQKNLARMAVDTIQSLEVGNYVDPAGNMVVFEDLLEAAVDGTTTYGPLTPVPLPIVPGPHATQVSVVNEGTMDAAQRLRDAGWEPAALNFASAKNPGGGFLNGAQAQEESITRVSGLYSCIVGNEMYRHHIRNTSALYSHYVIYSPKVPVLKDGEGTYLEEPWTLDIITSPSPNAGAYKRNPAPGGDYEVTIRNVYRARAEKILAVAASMGVRALVLGAWGCGVFGCDPDMAAAVWADLLATKFQGVFEVVVFAILERDPVGLLGQVFRHHLLPAT